MIDTPVSGSVSVVESGTITVMVGGDQEALDQARGARSVRKVDLPSRRCRGRRDHEAGDEFSVHSLNVAVSEALVLAEKAGLDRETVYDIFEAGAAGAPYVKYKRAVFLRPGEIPVAFSLALVAKDQELIHDLAQQTGTRMDQAEASRQLVGEAIEAGLAERDISEVASSPTPRVRPEEPVKTQIVSAGTSPRNLKCLCRLPTADCRLPPADCRLPTADLA